MKLDFLQRRDRALSDELGGQTDIDAAVLNYQLAQRMQDHLPRVLDIEAETPAVHRLYGFGSGDPQKERYATHCLRARRLIEAGVRFIEIVTPPGFSGNGSWDQHGELKKGHEANCFIVDQPIAALICDLKSRGLFDETIIVIVGEMGRTPHSTGRDGRDHHTSCFSAVVAGGGFKKGFAYGETDEFGMSVVENPVSVHDLHATVLHQLGLDHEALTYRFSGRDFTLPDVEGHVNHQLILSQGLLALRYQESPGHCGPRIRFKGPQIPFKWFKTDEGWFEPWCAAGTPFRSKLPACLQKHVLASKRGVLPGDERSQNEPNVHVGGLVLRSLSGTSPSHKRSCRSHGDPQS